MTIRTISGALCASAIAFALSAPALAAGFTKTDIQALCIFNNTDLRTGRVALSRTATNATGRQLDEERAKGCANGGTAHARNGAPPPTPVAAAAPAPATEATPAPAATP